MDEASEDDVKNAGSTVEADAEAAKRTVRTRAREAAEHLDEAASEIADDASDAEDELEDRVASLSDQLADLAHQVEQFAEARLSDVRDVAVAAGEAGSQLARRAGRQTQVAARAVRDDPLPAVVALGVLALLTAMVMSRRGD